MALINLDKGPKSQIYKLFENLWSKKETILLNTVFSLLLASIQKIQFFYALQITNISFADSFNIFTFLRSILWIIYEATIIYFLVKAFFTLNPEIPSVIKVKARSLFNKKAEIIEKYQINDKDSVISQKLKKKYSFFFGNMLKENHRGTSYLIYRISKKILLPLIHVGFHQKVEDFLHYVIYFVTLYHFST